MLPQNDNTDAELADDALVERMRGQSAMETVADLLKD